MSPLMGRPSLTGTALMGRAALLLGAILLASAPMSMLLAGSSWFTLTLTSATPVIVGGVVLRALLKRPLLVPLAQVALVVVMVLVVESAQGLISFSEGPAALVAAQAGIFPGAVSELASGTAPLTLGSRGTVAVVLLIALVTLMLDLMFVDLGWHTPPGLAIMGAVLVPALQQPSGGAWWTIAGPLLGGLLLLATRTVHADPSYIEGDRRPQAGPLPAPRRTTGAVAVCALLAALLAVPLGGALPQVAPTQVALDMDVINQWQNRDMPQLGPVMIDDDISVRRSLLEQSDTEVLRYTTTAEEPSYLRLRTLNSFDGETYSAEVSGEEPLLGRSSFSDARDDGTAVTGSEADLVRTELSVMDLAGDRLPAPDMIRGVETSEPEVTRTLSLQPTGGEIGLRGVRTSLVGLDYTVLSEESDATAGELREVDPDLFALPFEAGYTQPGEVPQIATDLADQVRDDAGAENGFDTALAYQDFFRSSFAYSLTVNSPPGEDPLESFLADRIGYCEQFAAAFALMMTSQGYPARVAIGFTPGEEDGDQRSVSAKNAHAWPEVWFGPQHGWVRFEPTPSAAANGVTPPGITEDGSDEEDAPDPAEEPSEPSAPEETEEASTGEEATSSADEEGTTDASASDGGGLVTDPATAQRVESGVLTLLMLGAAVAAGGMAAVILIRRHRVRRRDERWASLVLSGAETGGGAAGSDPAGAALLAERERRRAGELAWDELTRELVVRGRVIRVLGWTGAWGTPPKRLALDGALPPARALEDLLDQVDAGDVDVTRGNREAAARIASACTAARYAAPLDVPGAASASPSEHRQDPEGREHPVQSPVMPPLRADSDQLITLIRNSR